MALSKQHTFGKRKPRVSRQQPRSRPDQIRRGGRCRPFVEQMEDRTLLHGTALGDSFLLTPVAEGVPLAMHIHPHLSILIDGQQQVIPADIGVGPDGELPIHTHDTSGTIHIESAEVRDFRLGDFFTVWGQPFDSEEVLGYHADANHVITMTVDGRPSMDFGALVLNDGEDIVIRADMVSGATQTARFASGYGDRALSFQPNYGQASAAFQFVADTYGYSLSLGPTEAMLNFATSRAGGAGGLPVEALGFPYTAQAAAQMTPAVEHGDVVTATLHMQLVGANPTAQGMALDKLPGTVSYFIGNDPTQWRTAIPTYARVRYADVYPGIDVVYYGKQSELEYDFVVTSGANPGAILLNFQEADSVAVGGQGDLVVNAGGQETRFQKPVVYQDINENRQEVSGQYVVRGDHLVGFQLGAYDPARPLVIDPRFIYELTSSQNAFVGEAIALDKNGNTYVTGRLSAGPGRRARHVFVLEIDPQGNQINWVEFGANNGDSEGAGIAVDDTGIYITGTTQSPDFPIVGFAYERSFQGVTDAFVMKLSLDLKALSSTYLGGRLEDHAQAIAVGKDHSPIIVGGSYSNDFPMKNPLERPFGNGAEGAFAVKLTQEFDDLVYSTILPGTVGVANGVAVDGDDNAYITGTVHGGGTTLQGHTGGWLNAFVAKLSPEGAPRYYDYVGGKRFTRTVATAIAVDSDGNAYITGSTDAPEFAYGGPVLPYQLYNHSVNFWPLSGYVAKVRAGGGGLDYATYLGGSDREQGRGIAVDRQGNAYVTGITSSFDFPLKDAKDLQNFFNGGDPSYPKLFDGDAFITQLNPFGSALVYSTYLGLAGSVDSGYGIAVDADGSAYITGHFLGSDALGNGGTQGGVIARITGRRVTVSLKEVQPNQGVKAPIFEPRDALDPTDPKPSLVAGRPTVWRVKVDVEGEQGPELLGTALKVSLTFQGRTYSLTPTFQQLKDSNSFVDFRVDPFPELGAVPYIVTLDPSATPLSYVHWKDLSVSGHVKVKQVRPLGLAFERLEVNGFRVDDRPYRDTIDHNLEYLRAAYPVEDVHEVQVPVPHQWLVSRGNPYLVDEYARQLARDLSVLARDAGIERFVLIAPAQFFETATPGFTYPGIDDVVFVQAGHWGLAHELGHTYGLGLPIEDYDSPPVDWPAPLLYAGSPSSETGYWVDGMKEIRHAVNTFMGAEVVDVDGNPLARTAEALADISWTSDQYYLKLFQQFAYPQPDPAVLLIRGTIDRSRNVQIDPMYQVTDGVVSHPRPGDAAVRVLDMSGNVVGSVRFAVDFRALTDPPVSLDIAPFSFAVPYPANASSVQIVWGGQVLARIPITSRLLHDAILSIPDSGFVRDPERLRQDLLGQVDVLDDRLAGNDFLGARDTLFAIREQLVDGLFDDYPTESVLEYSKAAVLALVDELVERTGVSDLSVGLSATPDRVAAGSEITYTITLTNRGPHPAFGVTVNDQLPDSVTFVSCSPTNGGVCGGSGSNRTITFDSLAVNASATVTIVAAVQPIVADRSPVTNRVTVVSAGFDPDAADNSATVTVTTSSGPRAYTIIDLGTLPGGSRSGAWAINDLGEVVGNSDTSSSSYWHGFVYTDGGLLDLNKNGGAYVQDINNAGQVVGYVRSRASIYSDGSWTALSSQINGCCDYPLAVNDAGQVVGSVDGNSYFFWNSGVITYLDFLEGDFYAGVVDLNNLGQVIGRMGWPFQQGFLWSAQDGLTRLAAPGMWRTTPYDINDLGQIVIGADSEVDGASHLFVYSDGVYQDVAQLSIPGVSSSTLQKMGINNRGTIVGYAWHLDGSRPDYSLRYPFIYSGGTLTDLNDLLPPNSGWVLGGVVGYVLDLNEAEQIVGTGLSPSGQEHAFLLNPVANPTTPPPGAPGAPTALRAEPEDAGAVITWSPPSSDATSPVDRYDVAASDWLSGETVTATVPVTDPDATSFATTLTGLRNGTTYSVSVTAHNAAGSGAAITTSATPRTLPGAPADLGAMPGDGTAVLTWRPPDSDGGAPVDHYTVTLSAGAYVQTILVSDLAAAFFTDTAGTTAYGLTVTGLANGVQYTVSVTSHNAVGEGGVMTTSVTPAALPGAPTGLVAAPDVRQVSLSWLPPTLSGGSQLTGYTVTYSDGTASQELHVSGTGTSITVSGLGDGTTYFFRVRAVNAVGDGPDGEPVSTLLPGVPGTPTDLLVSAGAEETTVTWKPNASNSGAPIDRYEVTTYSSLASGDLESTAVTVTVTVSDPTAGSFSATLPGLQTGSGYVVQVTAHNAVGYGLPAGEVVALPATPANQPPVAEGKLVGMDEDTPTAITLTGSDADGDPLTYVLVGGPSHGTLSGTGSNLTYTPEPNYSGSDSFTFRVNDGTVDSNEATVSITVYAVNHPPTAVAQSVVVDENTWFPYTLSGSDPDNDPLTFIIVTGPSHGTLSGSGAYLVYRPAQNYQGPDSFAFKVNDGTVDSNVATVSIAVRHTGCGPDPAARPAVRFVQEVYCDLFDRALDPEGLIRWPVLLDAGLPPAQVVARILTSEPHLEYRRGQMRHVYGLLLGRPTTQPELAAGIAFLQGGGTVEQLMALVAGSWEYLQRNGGSTDGFLQALYRDLLGRGIDDSGQAHFRQALADGASREQVAAAVLGSDEYYGKLVRELYQQYLHRPASLAEVAKRVASLRQGQRTEELVSAILGSQEYYGRAVSVGPMESPKDVATPFITFVYHEILGREPDHAGLFSWTGFLKAGGTRGQLVRGFWESAEHRGLQVDQFYATYLHRPADPFGRAFWVGQLRQGVSEADVARHFLLSAEYQAAHLTQAGFVGGLYADVLGRTGDMGGMTFWVSQFSADVSRAMVAQAFLTSKEAYRTAVDRYYEHLLKRRPDPREEAGWLAAKTGRGMPEAEMAVAFLASEEFFARAAGSP